MPIFSPTTTIEGFILFILVGLFMAYLWYQDRFAGKNKATPETCALAAEKVKNILSMTDIAIKAREKLEQEMLQDKKDTTDRFCEVIESNVRAFAGLDSSIKILASVVEGLRNDKR